MFGPLLLLWLGSFAVLVLSGLILRRDNFFKKGDKVMIFMWLSACCALAIIIATIINLLQEIYSIYGGA